MKTLLDTVEPDAVVALDYNKRHECYEEDGIHNRVEWASKSEKNEGLLTAGTPLYSRSKVESLLTECRKQTLLEAMGISEYYATNSVTARNIRDELRRMTEGEMK